MVRLGGTQNADSGALSADDITEDASHMLMITGAVTERYIQKQIGQFYPLRETLTKPTL